MDTGFQVISSDGKGHMTFEKAKEFGSPFATYETIDVEYGNYLNSMNTTNRRIRMWRVESYVEAIKNGKFFCTSDNIGISADGRLVNGQHRIRAILMSGVPVKMLVSWNLPPESYDYTDRGIARANSDLLEARGERNQVILNAALRLLYVYENGLLSIPNRIEFEDLADILDLYGDDVRNGVTESFRFPKSFSRGIKTILSAAISVGYASDEEQTNVFFHNIKTGESLNKNSPRLILRNNLLSYSYKSLRESERLNLFAQCILAMNAYVKGKKTAKLFWTPKFNKKLPKFTGF